MYVPKKVVWNDKFKTGDDSIDFQHKYLLETFNKLGDVISEEFGRQNINIVLDRLKFYSEWHFGKEEECMNHYNCPAAEVNKSAHDAFKKMLSNYQNKIKITGGSQELAIEIHTELLEWLTNHILDVDVRLYPCIHKTK